MQNSLMVVSVQSTVSECETGLMVTLTAMTQPPSQDSSDTPNTPNYQHDHLKSLPFSFYLNIVIYLSSYDDLILKSH